jgi:predicted PurR-regulated permease PerM
MSNKDSEKPAGQTPEQDDTLFEWRRRNVLRGWTLFFLVVFFVLFLLLMWKAVPVLLLIFAGALIALALRYLSDNLSKWTGIPPLAALTFVLVVIVGGGTVAGVLAAPSIAEQTRELGKNLQESVSNLESALRQSETGNYILGHIEGLGEEVEDASALWQNVAGLFTTTIGAIAGFFLTLTVGIFLAYNPRLYVSGFLRLVPMAKRERTCEIITRLGYTLRWWMVGQLISMVVLAVTTWVMLWLLGVPLAFILALLTGLLTFIPYLGPLIAAVPILLIAFVESPQLALWVLILYLVIQNVEANVLMPIIFQKTIHLPPVLSIVAQILLGGIFGFIGIILATPLMAAGIDLIKMVYVEDVLGDDMSKRVPHEPH